MVWGGGIIFKIYVLITMGRIDCTEQRPMTYAWLQLTLNQVIQVSCVNIFRSGFDWIPLVLGLVQLFLCFFKRWGFSSFKEHSWKEFILEQLFLFPIMSIVYYTFCGMQFKTLKETPLLFQYSFFGKYSLCNAYLKVNNGSSR